jgi:hypothetical protein
MLRSIDMISSQTTQSSSCQGGATAPVTHAPSGREKIPIPGGSSPARRHIPSSWGRPSHPWSILPSNKKGTRPFMQRYNASAMPMIKSETWPKIWPISRNCTTTPAGKSKTLYGPSRGPMPSTASSHTSSTMPRRPRISPEPCLMPASMTSPMGGSTDPNSTTNDASDAKGVDTPHATAPESINASCATGMGIKSSTVESPTNDARQEEYAAFLTTTPEWPIPIARRTSGPSDDEKDVNKGVMS